MRNAHGDKPGRFKGDDEMDGTTQTIPQLTANDIPWTLEPTARLEDVRAEDLLLLLLTPAELLSHVQDVRDDLRAVRLTLHQALALVARQQDQLSRAARIVDFQRQQLREQRDRAAA
jgi:hypothetical protein